ncbi:hypothetical protein A0M37_03170 [Campylobacter jejuni]|uniref:hypothetical protein n=1 Tax=Campylobacter jejuni TaxID=197 RepID=UPI0008748545|nr:hypothetical protein [Campylobacter jejuni]EDO9221837.1 hypothetical protein [Campylobacter coli]OEW12552.1 hypothetical protein AJ935_09125 [Campylobacter sp. BCW_6876]EAH5338761.1 hypothetical protein [Campylobacter jejuni]EAH8023848.1 hypothetical protein [Campylobacter jejuni]EAI2643335.1 hypothetical protein [Campylobacter jejuni]
MKLYMNSDKLSSIENNKLRAIYKDIKEKLVDIIVYMDTINLGNISKGYIEKELNSIILILNQNCKEYFLIKNKLHTLDLERNEERLVQQAQKLFDKLKNLDFKKEINIEKDIKLDHIENSLDNSIKNRVQ